MLYIMKKDYNAIVDYCKQCLPYEACGLFGGVKTADGDYIKKVYFLTNIEKSCKHFSISPKEQLNVVKDMRKNSLEALGNFHSHPKSLAEPSREDKRLAYDLTAIYMIVSLADIDKPVLNAFKIDEEKNVYKKRLVIL